MSLSSSDDETDDDQSEKEMSEEDCEVRAIIHAGDLMQCKLLLESGKRSVNQADEDGCFILQWAALSNQLDIMR